MIDLYYWTTPNGHKLTIFLEEAGLAYSTLAFSSSIYGRAEPQHELIDRFVGVVARLLDDALVGADDLGRLLLDQGREIGEVGEGAVLVTHPYNHSDRKPKPKSRPPTSAVYTMTVAITTIE